MTQVEWPNYDFCISQGSVATSDGNHGTDFLCLGN